MRPAQPIMSREQASQFLSELKAAYQSISANSRELVKVELEDRAKGAAWNEEILAEQDRVLRLDRPELFEEFRSGDCSEQVIQLLALRYPAAVLSSFAGENQRLQSSVQYWTREIEYVGYNAMF